MSEKLRANLEKGRAEVSSRWARLGKNKHFGWFAIGVVVMVVISLGYCAFGGMNEIATGVPR